MYHNSRCTFEVRPVELEAGFRLDHNLQKVRDSLRDNSRCTFEIRPVELEAGNVLVITIKKMCD